MQQIPESYFLVAATLEAALARIELSTAGHIGIFSPQKLTHRTNYTLPFYWDPKNLFCRLCCSHKMVCEVLRLVLYPCLHLHRPRSSEKRRICAEQEKHTPDLPGSHLDEYKVL